MVLDRTWAARGARPAARGGSRRIRALGLAGALLVIGCGPQPEPVQTSGDDLVRVGGCGDALLYGTDGDDSVALLVRWADAASRAVAAGGFEADITLPHEEVEVELWRGEDVTIELCTDALLPGGPPDPEQWEAVAGEVAISVEPEQDADERAPHATATVTVRDLEFEPSAGTTEAHARIDEAVLSEVLIGWVPG